jgi:alkanesulfonate monooxygenase SsuD/methylene tetrahydromethanopterin reductase-like flavin-dependent oxidoreductase (luciferase family)
VRHAIYAPPFETFGDVHTLVELAVEAEAAGWDGFYLWDHVLYETDVPFVDAWIALTAIACSTERIRLGPLITPLPRRRVWKVAREAVTLDHLSRGRLTLGVGLGIDFWREFSAFDEPATDDAIRARILDEGIDVLRALWSGEPVTHDGHELSVHDVRFLPIPAQQPSIPIWSSAIWPIQPGPLRRAVRCDGVMPFTPSGLTPDDVHALRARLVDAGPVGDGYDICLHGSPSLAADFAAAGVTWFCMSFGPDEPLAEVRRVIAAGPPSI